jgi:hypothetical protein
MSWLVAITEHVIVVIDAFALVTVVAGTVEAFLATVRTVFRPAEREARWHMYANFGRWLVAGPHLSARRGYSRDVDHDDVAGGGAAGSSRGHSNLSQLFPRTRHE